MYCKVFLLYLKSHKVGQIQTYDIRMIYENNGNNKLKISFSKTKQFENKTFSVGFLYHDI